MTTKRIALYARVSTNKHECRSCRKRFGQPGDDDMACPRCGSKDIEQSQTPATQMLPLRQCRHVEDARSVVEYMDRESSGKTRPRLEDLRADARKHKFDVVVVVRFDRFARSVKELIEITAEFKALGIKFVSLTENIDTTTAMGEFFFHIIAAFAQFERAIIQERTRMGLDRARSEGKHIGRPTVIVDRVKVAEKVARGESISQVARESGIARSTVRQILRSEQKKSGGGKANGGVAKTPYPAETLSD